MKLGQCHFPLLIRYLEVDPFAALDIYKFPADFVLSSCGLFLGEVDQRCKPPVGLKEDSHFVHGHHTRT